MLKGKPIFVKVVAVAVAILLAALTLWVALQDFRVMRSPDPAAISMKASTSP